TPPWWPSPLPRPTEQVGLLPRPGPGGAAARGAEPLLIRRLEGRRLLFIRRLEGRLGRPTAPRQGLQWERRRPMGTHVDRRDDAVARGEDARAFEIVAVASSAGGLAARTSL